MTGPNAPSPDLVARLAATLGAVPSAEARLALAAALETLGWMAEAEAVLRLHLAGGAVDAAALAWLGRLAASPGLPPSPAEAAAEAAARAAPDELREAAWRGLLALIPDNVAAQMELGHACRAGGRPDAAVAHFQAATRLAPEAPWAAQALADTLRQLGRLAGAEAVYRQLLEQHPGTPEALAGLGECRRLRGDAAEARAVFQALRALAPERPEAALGLAELDLAAGDAGAAATGFAAALALAPGHPGARMGLGYAAMALGDPAAARPHFAAVAAAQPGAAWARLALAEAELALGAAEPAIHEYRAALAADPGSAPARRGLLAALTLAGRVAEALAAARAAVDAMPGEPAAQLALGQAARAAGDHASAVEAFAAAAALAPTDPQPLVEAAVARRALGEPAAALALLRQALAIDPGHVPALENLAAHHRQAGALEAALASFRAGIATGRPGPWCYLGAAEIEAELGRLPAALALLEAGARALPAVAALPAKRLELMRRGGLVPEALAEARARSAPGFAQTFAPWFERVLLEHHAGDATEAARLLATPPPTATLEERARALHLRGLVAADHWDLATGEALLAEAAALAPDDPWPRARLTMLRLARADAAGVRAALAETLRIEAAATRLQGRVARISQSFHGQLLDDLLLEAGLLAELAALAAQPAATRLAPLCALVRQQPEHFGAAFALAVALRQSGGFALRPLAGAPAIPPRIAQYWDAAALPADLAALMASWQRSGLAHRRFDDAAATAWMQARPAPLRLAWQRAGTPTRRADLLRLAVLAEEGGWWADADDRLFGDLAALAPPGATLVLYQEDLGSIGNNLIGAVPGHPLLAAALRLAVEAINRGDADMVWLQTGPGLLTRVLAEATAAEERVPAGVLVHDQLAALRQVAMHCLAEYKTHSHWMKPPATGGRAAPAPRCGTA